MNGNLLLQISYDLLRYFYNRKVSFQLNFNSKHTIRQIFHFAEKLNLQQILKVFMLP